MDPIFILYPLFGMAALTFYITIRMGKLRVRAVLQDGLKTSYFKTNTGAEPPEYMVRTEQHYVNLFEQPVLFYAICLIAFATKVVDPVSIALAWAFLVSRYIHSYTHLGSNKLLKRRRIFIISLFILIGLWSEVLVQLLLRQVMS